MSRFVRRLQQTANGRAPTANQGELLGWQLTPQVVGLTPFGLDGDSLPVLNTSSWQNNTVPAGTVISGKLITNTDTLYLWKGNITIEKCCIKPTPGSIGHGSTALQSYGSSGQSPQGSITIRDCEYDGSLLGDEGAFVGFFNGGANFLRNYVHDSGSGIGFQGVFGALGSTITVANNYVDGLLAIGDPSNGGNHSSAFTVRDFPAGWQLAVRNNYFRAYNANVTGAFFIQPNGDEIWNMTASGNLLAGKGYQLMLEDDQSRFPGVTYHNMRATNNRFINNEYGPTLLRGTGEGWTEWSENYMYDAAAADCKGAVITKPVNDN
jgi:hypothetical protein